MTQSVALNHIPEFQSQLDKFETTGKEKLTGLVGSRRISRVQSTERELDNTKDRIDLL